LLALTKAYRAKSASAFTRITSELSQRLGLSVDTTDIPTVPIPVDTTNIADAFSLTPSAPDAAKPISERDAAILALAKIGTKKRAIGRQLGIPESTVRWVIEQHTTH
jgi:DNA-binding NarL/FixJ family response regulator